MKRIFFCFFIFFILINGFLFSANSVNGQIMTIDENGYLQPVNGATVRVCGTSITDETDENGTYTFAQPEFYIDKYILKATKSGFVTTYTGITPTDLIGSFNRLNYIIMLPFSYAPSSGKSHLIVITFNSQAEGFIYGASARVYNSNNQRVDNQQGVTVKYIKYTDGQPPKIELVDAPSNDTIGYIVQNINPQYYSISAYKEGINFIHRPVMTFSNSITSCCCELDGVWSAEGIRQEIYCQLKDENDIQVEGATVKTVGPNYSGTTDTTGQFILKNIPYPSVFFFKATRTNYKDTYQLLPITGDIISPFFILSEASFNKAIENLNITVDRNKGQFVGMVVDANGYPIRNVYVEILNENGENIPGIDLYFMDSNKNYFDSDLESTTDSGIFLIPNLDPEKVYYLKFILNEITVAIDMAIVFRDGVTWWQIQTDILKGYISLYVSCLGPKVVDKNASNIEVLRFSLRELTNIEDIQINRIKITDINTGDMSKISAVLKYGKSSYCNGIIEGRNITFTPTDLVLPKNTTITLCLYYSFNNANEEDKYCPAILNNSDITGIGEISQIEVSVERAPIYDNIIVIKKEGTSDITVDPNNINFGLVKVGETTPLSGILVINSGELDLVIGEVIISGDKNDFIVDVSNISSKTLIPGAYNYINVQFTPKSNGIKTLTITIPSNDPDENPYNITLTGEGYGEKAGGGCFIATACFGNYNHPVVKILREFRDRCLIKNKIGKIFVNWYYKHSPKYSEIIKKSEILKFGIRICLYPVALFIWLILKGLLMPLLFIISLGIFLKQTKYKT
ncbi:MAG: choice-of-anchor D domain-containing protein [Candidatus Omnitrophica bacterium]|nr:choice-of-anchor D domain-containing protein [Candidatus Omnitrophota bacterium]